MLALAIVIYRFSFFLSFVPSFFVGGGWGWWLGVVVGGGLVQIRVIRNAEKSKLEMKE